MFDVSTIGGGESGDGSDEKKSDDPFDDVEFEDNGAPPNDIPRDKSIEDAVEKLYEYINDEKQLKTYDDTSHAIATHKTPRYLNVDNYSRGDEEEVKKLNHKGSTWLYCITTTSSRMYKSPFPLPPHIQPKSHVDLTFSLEGGDYLDLEQQVNNLMKSPLQIKIDTSQLRTFLNPIGSDKLATRDYDIKPLSIRVLRVQNDLPFSLTAGLYTNVPGTNGTERKLWCDHTEFYSWDGKQNTQ